ncbi:MAG: type II toxin-antitoxin system RelE/ParE family toxin [Cyclobacteriaceae bacterium]|nr:type II toxin-antitoxin system RelE/ParE family toxin [Cyclobacteriaceae bacterium]
MVQINWTLQARNDLKSIAEYIKLDSVRYAKLQVIKIKSRTHILRSFPLAGREVPEIENQKIRELIEGNYRIIYKVLSDKRVDILVVHHSTRDLSQRGVE